MYVQCAIKFCEPINEKWTAISNKGDLAVRVNFQTQYAVQLTVVISV